MTVEFPISAYSERVHRHVGCMWKSLHVEQAGVETSNSGIDRIDGEIKGVRYKVNVNVSRYL